MAGLVHRFFTAFGKRRLPMEVASAFRSGLLRKARKSTEGQEDQAQPKPSRQNRGMNASDYTRFSPLALNDEPVALFCRGEKALNRPRVRFERAVRNRVGLVAARCLSSRAFRNTLSTPSAADSEFSPAVIERASGSCRKRRGRKFAESDAFFGGLADRADKFRILPFSSAISVVKKEQERLSYHNGKTVNVREW